MALIDFDIYRRSKNCIAQAALTNSKRPASFVFGVYPTHVKRGYGAQVYDNRGRSYIDFIAGLGANLLGYGQDQVSRAIIDAVSKGPTLSLSTYLEVETAEKVKEIFPFVERVKFLKTGSDACSASLKIARAHTERSKVLSSGYHGFHDDFVSLTEPAAGVPKRDFIETLKDLNQIDFETAAVIVEPYLTSMTESDTAYLYQLREACDRYGAMLIFDEVITGFRIPNFGISNRIRPDLLCIGKAMGNGLPISAVCGDAYVMDNPNYFVSSTFAGDMASLAAALKVMELLQTDRFSLKLLMERALHFCDRFNEIWPEGIVIEGYGTRGVFKARDELTRALFFQESIKAGLLFGPSFFFIFPHIPLASEVIATVSDILVRIKTGTIKLEGEMPQRAFAQKQREDTK